MVKIVIYAAMNGIYSSRDIESACRRDINHMYLLEGMPAPDHATIARFISLHFSVCARNILAQMASLLLSLGEISGTTVFIDGTKIEANANKYTFVWKKTITKSQAKLFGKVTDFVADCETQYGIRIVYHDKISLHTLKRLRKKLYAVKKEEGILFVHGCGKRKTPLQRSIEKLESYILTKSISRFARNTVDLLQSVRKLKLLGIEVRFEKEYIRTGGNPLFQGLSAFFYVGLSLICRLNLQRVIR